MAAICPYGRHTSATPCLDSIRMMAAPARECGGPAHASCTASRARRLRRRRLWESMVAQTRVRRETLLMHRPPPTLLPARHTLELDCLIPLTKVQVILSGGLADPEGEHVSHVLPAPPEETLAEAPTTAEIERESSDHPKHQFVDHHLPACSSAPLVGETDETVSLAQDRLGGCVTFSTESKDIDAVSFNGDDDRGSDSKQHGSASVCIGTEEIVSIWRPVRASISASLPDDIIDRFSDIETRKSSIGDLASMLLHFGASLPVPAREWLHGHAVQEAETIVRDAQRRRALHIQQEWRELADEERSRWQCQSDELSHLYQLALEEWREGRGASEPKRPPSAFYIWARQRKRGNS